MKERVLLFDIMKAFCVVEIVAFWHMLDYTPYAFTKGTLGEELTGVVLAAFTFSSGFFLGKKQLNALAFYNSRLKRFMLPLLASLLTFYVFGQISLRTVCFTAIGLSCFIPPMPNTLWFFSMIIFFYWITPVLLCGLYNMTPLTRIMNIVIRSTMLFMVIVLLGVDERIREYYPFYILGIVMDMSIIKTIIEMKPTYKIGGVVLWLLSAYVEGLSFVTNMLGCMLLLILSYLIEQHLSQKGRNFFLRLSYASMFAYLFHREFYAITKLMCAQPNGTLPVWSIAATILVIFLLSYYMQKCYDWIMARFS